MHLSNLFPHQPLHQRSLDILIQNIMPYIQKRYRLKLDPQIEELALAIKKVAQEMGDKNTDFAGVLHYCCTRLALEVIPERRYKFMAFVYGTLGAITEEFYRRYVAPYEDEQMKKNGDVYPSD
jgi:hypothetical protein